MPELTTRIVRVRPKRAPKSRALTRAVTPSEMREIDRKTIKEFGMPGIVLMERAALGAIDAMMNHFDRVECVGIVCGSGNNGGDGLAMARLLDARGVAVTVVLITDPREFEGEAATNWKMLESLSVQTHSLHDVEESSLTEQLESFTDCDTWCDALLGTGVDREVEGRWARVIEFLNKQERVFSLDIPSGVDALSGQVLGVAVCADACATFGMPKLGQLVYPGREHCGELYIAEIGLPEHVIEQVGPSGMLIDRAWVAHALKARPADYHKGEAGKVLVLAGSDEMTGAAILSARGALEGGAGLVTVGSRPAVVERIMQAVPEVMASAILGEESSDAQRRRLQQLLDQSQIVVMGPGLGQSDEVHELLSHVLLDPRQPLVLDADALNVVASHEMHDALRRGSMKRPIVLTPHPGEMGRLVDESIEQVMRDPIGHARDLAQVTQCTVVLKTASTVVAAADGRIAINTSGNPGMATAGMGDVLTGMIAARLAEHDDPFEAVCLAVWLHGAAGDLCRDERGQRGTTATGLLDHLGELFTQIEERCP